MLFLEPVGDSEAGAVSAEAMFFFGEAGVVGGAEVDGPLIIEIGFDHEGIIRPFWVAISGVETLDCGVGFTPNVLVGTNDAPAFEETVGSIEGDIGGNRAKAFFEADDKSRGSRVVDSCVEFGEVASDARGERAFVVDRRIVAKAATAAKQFIGVALSAIEDIGFEADSFPKDDGTIGFDGRHIDFFDSVS